MISEDDLWELLEEERKDLIDPEHNYCRGCGKLLNSDTKEEVFCAECE